MCEKVNVALCFQWSVRLEKQFVNAGPCLFISSCSTTTNIKLLPICRYLVFRFRWSVILHSPGTIFQTLLSKVLTWPLHYLPNWAALAFVVIKTESLQTAVCFQHSVLLQKQKVWLSDCCDSAFYTNSQQCSFWLSKSNYFSSTFLGGSSF